MPANATQSPADAPPAVVVHMVKFQRNVQNGLLRSFCSCGWLTAGWEDQVKNEAARHDLDWKPAS